MNVRRILIIGGLIILCCGSSLAQSQVCPPELVCISQSAANIAAQNARTVKAQEEKIAVLETSLTEKDKSIEQIRETARINDAEKTKALHATEIKLAEQTGENIQLKAMLNLAVTLLDTAMKNTRKKSVGLIAF